MAIDRAVEKKIADYSSRTETALSVFSQSEIKEPSEAIGRLYQNLVNPRHAQWAIPPAGTDLFYQLFTGPPAIIDLQPMPQPQFEAQFRMTVRAAEELAEKGLLLPNLYARTASDWTRQSYDTEYLSGLVDKSCPNGAIVDAYFRKCLPRYETTVGSRVTQLSQRLNESTLEDLRTVAKQKGITLFEADDTKEKVVRRMAGIFGKNWAYLDVLSKDSAEHLERAVDFVPVNRLLGLLKIAKHRVASPVTAALGGNFIWPERARNDLREERIHAAGEVAQAEASAAISQSMRANIGLVAHVLDRLAGIRPREVVNLKEASRFADYLGKQDHLLADFLGDEEYFRIRTRIWSLLSSINAMVARGEIEDASFEELERLYADVDERIEKWAKKVTAVGVTAGLVTVIHPSVPTLFPWADGITSGLGAAEMVVGAFGRSIVELIYGSLPTDRSRYYRNLGELK